MYAHYEPAGHVFVNREKTLGWMDKALAQCQAQSVLLHLYGIGGIGKTALLEHWKQTIESNISLDCNRITHLFDRLEHLARSAAQLGVPLQRFDLLWSIRLQFIKGLEPAKEPGRNWAYEVIRPIPFIGSLVNISKAIITIGGKVKQQLSKRFGDIADWLKTRLGTNYSERLLEVLWKEPHHAEFLYLDALLEDLNARKKSDPPLLILIDHMEEIETERLHWRYRGRNINEVELWFTFLSSLTNTVGVTASRKRLPQSIKDSITAEELELTELDTTSCHQLLTERGITEPNLQTQITSVSGGNPFVLHTICDMNELSTLSIDDVETLRADTLEQVRIKTWRRLFNQAKDLAHIIDRTGLLPFFNRNIMDIITPTMKSADWDLILQLSFIQDRGDGTWTLHALARELLLAELENTLPKHVSEVATLLEKAAKENYDATYKGLALSAKSLVNEPDAIIECCNYAQELMITARHIEAISMIDIIPHTTEESLAILKWLKGRLLGNSFRIAESEQELKEALPLFQKLANEDPEKFLPYLIWTNQRLITQCYWTGRFAEMEDLLQKDFQLLKQLSKMQPRPIVGYLDVNNMLLQWHYYSHALFLMGKERLNEAEAMFKKNYELVQDGKEKNPLYGPSALAVLHDLLILYLESGRLDEAEHALQEINRIAADILTSTKLGAFEVRIRANSANYTMLLSTGDFQEGIEELRNLIGFSRDYIKGNMEIIPGIALFAWFINLLGVMLRNTNRLGQANDAFKEALEFARFGYQQEPRTYGILYSMILNNHALLYQQSNQVSQAEVTHQECLHIVRNLSDQAPEFFLPYLAQSLSNYALFLRQSGSISEAESIVREALKIRRSRAEKNPDYYLYQVATSLNNLSVLLAEAKKFDEAMNTLQEAYKLRRTLFNKAATLYSKDFASTLTNLGVLSKRMERLSEAEHHYREAHGIWESLAEMVPEVFQKFHTQNLVNLAILLSETGDSPDDLDSIIKQLKQKGVSSLPENEIWFENDEDFFKLFSW